MKDFKKIVNKQLGEILIERGVINQEQLKIALDHKKEHGCLIGESLIQLSFSTEKDIAQAVTSQYGFPYLPLSGYDIDPEVIQAVPEHICRQFHIVPIDKIGKSLTVAMSNPLNYKALEDLELITGCHIQMFVSIDSEISEAINKYYTGQGPSPEKKT